MEDLPALSLLQKEMQCVFSGTYFAQHCDMLLFNLQYAIINKIFNF